MDIRRKHVYFMVCSFLLIYAMITSFALLGEKLGRDEIGAGVCGSRCSVCGLTATIVQHQKIIQLQQKMLWECSHYLTKQWGNRDLTPDEERDHEEEMGFHEYLIKEILGGNTGTDERKQSF